MNSIEDYYLYLLSDKFSKFNKYVDNIVPEHREKIENFSKTANEYIANFKKRNLIEYINSNYEEIFREEHKVRGIHLKTIDVLSRYQSGINKAVFIYLLDHHKSLLVINYNRFENFFEKYDELFTKLLEDIEIERNINLVYVLSILKYVLNKKKTSLKEYAEIYAESLETKMLNVIRNNDIEVYVKKKLLETYLDFLNDIKSSKFSIFEEEMIKINEELDIYLQENGECFSYTMSVENKIKIWDSFDKLNIQKLWFITHVKEKSNLSTHNSEKSLTDLVVDSKSVDDYFTIIHTNYLEAAFNIGSTFLYNILKDSRRVQEYGNLLFSSIEYLRESGIFNDKYFSKDLDILNNFLWILHVNINQDENTLRMLSYSVSIFVVSFTEKLFRQIYEYEAKGEIYYITGRTTMGDLLSEKNQIMKDIFGGDHLKNLAYYFITVGENKIGKNLRNDLAHLTRGIEDKFNVLTVTGLLYLLTNVVNTIFIKYYKY